MVQREICNTRWYQNFALFECLAVDKLTKWEKKKSVGQISLFFSLAYLLTNPIWLVLTLASPET